MTCRYFVYYQTVQKLIHTELSTKTAVIIDLIFTKNVTAVKDQIHINILNFQEFFEDKMAYHKRKFHKCVMNSLGDLKDNIYGATCSQES